MSDDVRAYVYPTADGGSQIEWGEGDFAWSVEVSPDGSAYFHETNLRTLEFQGVELVQPRADRG